jgi:hypothetical protein
MSRMVREIADGLAEDSRDLSREGERSFKDLSKDPDKKLRPSISVAYEAPRNSRSDDLADVVEDAASAGIAEPPAHSRSDAELDELLRPVCELAKTASLVGMTDREGLRGALAPYEDLQVRHAVRLTLAMAQAGTVKSPIGWLVGKARRGDKEFFPPVSSLEPPPPPRAALVLEDEPDPEADEAVTALESDPASQAGELARIDHAFLKMMPPRIGEQLMANPVLLHKTRAKHWRILHPRNKTAWPGRGAL